MIGWWRLRDLSHGWRPGHNFFWDGWQACPCSPFCSNAKAQVVQRYPPSLLPSPFHVVLIHHDPPEHLGLISPELPEGNLTVMPFMWPAPYPNEDNYTDRSLAQLVMDPVGESTCRLWNDTVRKNREVYTELFRPVPMNLVRNWSAYEVRTFYHGILHTLIWPCPWTELCAKGQDGPCRSWGHPRLLEVEVVRS